MSRILQLGAGIQSTPEIEAWLDELNAKVLAEMDRMKIEISITGSGHLLIAYKRSNTMSELTSHKVNPANDTLKIEVLDLPGSGNASHAYRVSGFDLANNPSAGDGEVQNCATEHTIYFQNGPIGEVGVNGVTNEALLAIVADRLESFQNGPYACPENGMALAYINDAQNVLQSRTRRRTDAGIEGTHALDPAGT